MRPRQSVLAAALMLVLLGLGLSRTGCLVLHRPLLGYANNYDFIKISSTVGMWADEPSVDPLQPHPAGPYSHYKFHGPKEKGRRYLSSELLLVYPALFAAEVSNRIRGAPEGSIDLRVVGATKMAAFFLVAVFLCFLFWRRGPWLGVCSAAVYAAVICDPANTLYFNTLYFDDSALLFGWLAAGCALLLAAKESPGWLLTLFCAALPLAGLSKMQHPGLPFAIAAVYALALRAAGRARGLLLWGPLGAAAVTLALGAINNQAGSMASMQQAAATDTWFGTVLPALQRPADGLKRAGLPERCAAYIGKTWYDPGMQPSPCPEVFRAGRARVVWVLLREPAALWKILVRSASLVRPRLEPYGQIEGARYGFIGALGDFRLFTLTGWTREMPVAAFDFALLVFLAIGAFSIGALLGGRYAGAAVFCLMLEAVFASTLAASLLGDGYMDLARHMHLACSPLFLLPAVSAAAAVQLVGLIRRAARKTKSTSGVVSASMKI